MSSLQTRNEISILETTPCETIFVAELEDPSPNLNGDQSTLDTLSSTLAVVPVKSEIELGI